MATKRRGFFFLLVFGLAGMGVGDAFALPLGRAWTPVEHLGLPGVPHLTFASGPRLEVDGGGIPQLICVAYLDTSAIAARRLLLSWGQSGWEPKFTSEFRGGRDEWPFLSSNGKSYLEWLDLDNTGYAKLLLAEIGASGFGVPDTAMDTYDEDTEFSGAASGRGFWLVRSQQRFPVSTTRAIRTVYSDTRGIWHELPELGVDEDHCAAAPLSDNSALVVYAGESGLGWARAEGNAWAEQGNLDPRRFVAAHPRLRFRPSGGLWLLWTERYFVHVSSYRDGQWLRGDSLTATHPPGQTFWSAWCDASRDTAERPVLVWSDLGYAYTYRDVACIAMPTDSGWTEGEEIPGSEHAVIPTVTRDLNGDAWVAWAPLGLGTGSFYLHTYTTATASKPRIADTVKGRVVSWSLSEPAPETWWAVLRAEGAGEFQPAARVRAGPALEMSWREPAPLGTQVRYKIRRECVDTRYQWEGEAAAWPTLSHVPVLLGPPRLPIYEESVNLSLTEATPGPIELRLYDVQGRLVLAQRAQAAGETLTITLDLKSSPRALTSGIYFAQARDGAGRLSNAVRLVILR